MSDELYLAVVRRRIKGARLAKNLRQEDVADMLGVSVRSYQRYESGNPEKQFNPYVTTIRRIAQVLEVDVGEITREVSAGEIDDLNERRVRNRGRRRPD